MSVFRYGLVGPNFQPNLLSERAAGYREGETCFASPPQCLSKERENG